MSKSERGAERERRRVAPAASRMGLLDVFKDGELVETIELSASKRVYKVGRQAGLADIVLSHGSISREQATLTVSASGSVSPDSLRLQAVYVVSILGCFGVLHARA